MKHAMPATLEPIMVPGGYVSPEIHDDTYVVWFGYVLHRDDTTEYVGSASSQRQIANAVYDTYRKGPMADD